MSTVDPTGGGGGGGTSTSVDGNASPGTPSTDIAVPPGSQHQQHPPPSPLSGCYLLVVLPEPHTAQHRDLILNRLAKGFLSWDKDSCHVDLEKELQALVAQAPEGEEARNGERLIQYATENLVTEVLIHPQTNTLLQCIRNLLASFTKHRHIIHAGYTFGGNGSWILQDGTFSLADFLDAFSEHEVQRVLRAYENSVTVDINCAGVGEWSTIRLSKEACTRSCRVRLNPDDVLTAGVPAIASFTNYVGQYLAPQTLDQLMEPSDVVGNIRFSHPTLYVFPGGQGDAALFGINGFNMLVDGGFARKACFWDFARHLDRLDAVLVTRVNNSNVGGMSSVLRKKREMHVYPQIGHFFCNLVERRHSNSPDGDKDLDPLTLNLIDIGQEMMVDLRQINLRAHPCYRDPNPINLYHKVGHGTLDMYVLSPSKDSREVREFLSKWHSADSKLFAGSHKKDSNNLTFPIQNLASICALLVWQPANPEDTITRILFPGSTPQHKIFEGFERLKHLDFLKHPVCSAKSLSPSTSLLTLKDRPTIKQKLGLIEKESKKSVEPRREKRDLPESKASKAAAEDIVSKPSTPQATPVVPIAKAQPPKIDVKTKKVVENKKIETESKKIEKDLKEMKKESTKKDIAKMDKEVETKKSDVMKIKSDSEKPIATKEIKAKAEPKKKDVKDPKLGKVSKPEMPSKPAAKLPDRKPKPTTDKKESVKASPPTPKKTINGLATKAEVAKSAPRPITKPAGKQLPLSTPAKSAKDANNRKVVEQKNNEIASAASGTVPVSAKLATKPKTAERKPISRRTKPVSPSKARVPGSPAKSTRSTPTTSVKSDKDGVIRKVKGDRGTTDSSTVSTPSGIEIDSMTKLADKSLTEKSEDMSLDSIESKVLADLKEEREVVEEIEAVLQKAERIEEARKDDHLDGDDDITAEATDKKEDDMTEDDVTADIEEAPKKKTSRKASQELTEEDEYLIVEKEEIYIEDSAQSGEGEQKHVLDAVESEKMKPEQDVETAKEDEEAEISEEKEKSDVPEKKLPYYDGVTDKEKEADEMSPGHKEQLKEEMKDIIASATEIVQKVEDKDDSGKKDSEDITKEPSSLSPDKFDSSEKKTTDTDPMKPEVDQKDQQVAEKMEESQERISTLESGATTTAPTLPEDERIPLDDIKEVIDEKYIAEDDKEKEKESVEQVKESFVPPIPTEPKPDAKSFQVRPALQGIQREIVKTPDEVADLPVHEEVDPKLYRMEDFEKAKEEKPIVASAPQQPETKEPPTPPVKEQKGVFSFFGKVAGKFEKGMDKLTGKSRRDSEKDVDEKSSSKSSSPKEAKPQDITLPGDGRVDEVNEALAKAVKLPEISESFEKGEPEVSKVKVAAITDTAAFLQREIEDLTKSPLSDQETKDTVEDVESVKPEAKEESKPVISDPVFETCVLKGQQKDILAGPVADIDEDVEDVEALLEEASKKFKTVKDSLRDSLESLEEKIVEEEMVRAELAAASKDVVKDTLSEVVEKLEEIKPHIEEVAPSDTKEPEKVKFQVAKADLDVEESISDESEVTKDFKEAVRDVGEVLAGSAGILIEEKPKDVIEIVKKVAEELKKDDFLSHDLLFDKDGIQQADEKTSDGEIKSVKPVIEEIIPKKVGITEELPPQEEIEELLDSSLVTKPLESYKPADVPEVQEEPCTKTVASGQMDLASPIRDSAADKIVAMKICSDLMEKEPVPSRHKRSICDEDETKVDVMEAGVESVCIKKTVMSKQDDENREIQGSDIVFDRKLSPDKAQMVIVTPDSAPTSPQFPGAKMEHTKEGIDEITQLPYDVKNELDKQGTLEEIIENLVFSKKTKITIQIVEYITVTRKIPREKVVYIIEEIIIKKGVPRNSVVADLDLLKPDTVSSEKRTEIEQYIDQEYITKNKRITIDIVEEIAIKKFVTKRIVIEIIEEIIVKKKIPRDSVLDISEEEMAHLRGQFKETMSEPVSKSSSVIDVQVDQAPKTDISSTDVRSEIEKYIVDEIISKGSKITHHTIDDIATAKQVPRRFFIEILEEIIIQHKIPRTSILDMSEKELTDLIMSEKEDMDREEQISEMDQSSVSLETRLQIEKNIIDEYVTKNRRITPHVFEEICALSKVPRRIIIQIIEELVVKRKVPRSSILDVTDIELEELLSVDKEEDEKESDAAALDNEEKKHLESETEEYESVTTEKITEIENSVIEEYISKSRRITPYIFEDICIRYKIPRRILIEIIEEIIIKRNVRRGSILDITDVELSELLAAAEAGDEEEELDRPDLEQDAMPDDVGEDKLVDGFVSIPGKDVAPTTAVLTTKTVELAEPALKESEKDVTDDFEAVEQEYKIHGTAITTTRQSISLAPGAKLDEEKLTDDMEEAIEDDVSDVVEADEKTIDVVVPVTTSTTEKKSDDISETSEVVDTTEKYLIEAQEKAELKHEQDIVSDTHETDTAGRRDSAIMDKTAQMHADIVTEAGMPSTAKLQERKASEVKEPEDKDGPAIEDKTEVTRPKRSIDEISRKDSLELQEHVEVVSTSKVESPEKKKMDDITAGDETTVPTGTVRRMLVTASSEDGGQETVVCPTGSITFTTSITPEDSLKSSPVKTTPDQDSLLLDKESLRSGASTPEKDSVSGKSTPGTKDGDKITPEDSLDKSPLGTRDSQDLEDSLDKSDPTKLKEAEKPKSLTKTEEETTLLKSSVDVDIDRSVQGIIEEKESSSHAIMDDKPTEPVKSSRTPSVVGDMITGKDLTAMVDATLTTVVGEKDDEKAICHSKSPSVAGDRLDEMDISEVVEKSRSPSVASETRAEVEPAERSKSPSVAGDILAETSIDGGKIDEKAPFEQSKPSSIAEDKLSEKEASELHEKSRSPSVASEKLDDKEATVKSGTSSTAGEKITEKDLKEIVDEIKSPEALTETIDDKMLVDRSKSPSVVGDKLSEKGASEADERSRSPSIASEKQDDKESTVKSGTPSIAGDKITEKDLKEIVDEIKSSDTLTGMIDDKMIVDRSKSPSIAGEKLSEKEASDIDEKSRSPSIASEKHDDKEPTVKSGTPSIAGDKLSEKEASEIDEKSRSPSIASEKHDDKEPTVKSGTPSIAGDKLSDKEASEKDEKSRSPSIASEKHDDREPTVKSRTPSIAGDKISEMDLKEIVGEIKSSDALTETMDDKMSFDRSKSPSIAGDKLSEKEASEKDEKSRSPSIASEKPDGRETTVKSGTPSIAGDQITEKDIKEIVNEIKSSDALTETIDDKMSVDRSKSPSIAGDKLSEKEASETGEKSRSPSIASEQHDDRETTVKSGTPSIASDKITEKDLQEIVDEIKSSDALTETIDDKMSVDSSKPPSAAGDKLSEKEAPEKDDKSRSPSIASEIHDDREPTVRSGTSSIVGDKITEKDLKEIIDDSKSPERLTETKDDKVLIDRSKSPSIAGDKLSEKAASEADEKSRSPSISSEKHDDREPTVKLGTPSIAGDKITEKDLKEMIGDTTSPDAITETIDDKVLVDHSKSPSIAGDKLSEKEASERDEKSRSPSIAGEKPDDRESTVKSETPSIAGDKITEKDLKEITDEIKSSDALTETIDDKMSVDRSKSPSIADDKLSEKEASEKDEKSRSPSIASEKPDDRETSVKSGTPSVAGDKITEKDLKEIVDEIKSSDALTETMDDKMSVDRSKSPSIAGDKLSEKEASEKDEKSRSPSIASEKHDDRETSVKSGTPSIAGDKITEKDLKEIVDEIKSSDALTETMDDKMSVGSSKSPSVAGDKLSEKGASEKDEKSRSPSIASEKHEDREATVKSETPSIAGDKITEKDLKEIVDESTAHDAITETIDDRVLVDRSKSPSIAGDKPSEKETSEADEKSRSPSIASEKHDDSQPIVKSEKEASEIDEKSRSPSIASEKHDDREPTVKSGTPSIAGDKLSEKEASEIDEKSRSPSIASEKHDDREPTVKSGTPSIAGDKLSEKEASEKDEKSRSPSIASEKHDDREPTVKSETPSIAGDKLSDKEASEKDEKSRSPSIASEKHDDREPTVKSGTPSIAGDKLSEKEASEKDEKSRSPSIASEKHDDREPTVKSRTPSIAGDKITEKDLKEVVDESIPHDTVTETIDDKVLIDRSKSPSIAGDKFSEKGASEADEKSRSPSIASEKDDGKESTIKSETPSIAGDKFAEKDLKEIVDAIKSPEAPTETIDHKMLADRSKSPSIAGDKPGEKETSEADEKSRSPSIASEKDDGKEPTTKSGTPSIVDDKITEKDLKEIVHAIKSPDALSEAIDDKMLVDRSKSPSVAGDKSSEKGASEADEKSRSPSIASEIHDDREVIVKSGTPSIAGDKITEKDLKEMVDEIKSPDALTKTKDDKVLIDRSKSPSITGDKLSEKVVSEADEKSRSPSIASEKHDDKEPTVKSGTPSIAGDKITEKDLKEIIDDTTSPDAVTKTIDEKVLVDRSKSPSIAGDTLSEKGASDVLEKSRTPSIASEKHDDREIIVKSGTPSIAGDKITEKDIKEIVDECKSLDASAEMIDDKMLVDRSKSPSIAGDKSSEKETLEADAKSRSPSIASEKHDDDQPIVKSGTPSIAGDKITEKDLREIVDEIKLPDAPTESIDRKMSVELSKSPSISGDKPSEKGSSEVDEKSRSPSIASDKHDGREPTVKSGTPSIAGDKITEKDLKDIIDETTSSDAVTETIDDKILADRSKSPSIAGDKLSEKGASEADEKSRSPSIVSEKHDDKEPTVKSRTPSLAGDKITEKDLKEIIDESKLPGVRSESTDDQASVDRSKSPSIAGDKQSEKEVAEEDVKSRSPSIATAKHDEEEFTVKSGTPSVAGDRVTEKDPREIVDDTKSTDGLTETKEDKVLIDRSKSPSITGDKLSEKAPSEADEKSRSPSITSEKHDDKEPIVKSETSSIAGSKISEKDLKEIIDESQLPDALTDMTDSKVLVERSKSPRIAGEEHSEKAPSEADGKSRSPSIFSEKHDEKELIVASRTSSIVGDKIVTEKDLKEIVDEIKLPSSSSDTMEDKASADRSKSPSIADDKHSEVSEAVEKSRSPSITSDKHDDKELIAKSGTSSVAGEKITEKDLKEITDEFKPLGAPSEKVDEKVTVDRSKSPSIASDKHSEKDTSELDEKSRSPSITSEKHDDKDTASRSRSASVTTDKIIEKDLKSPSAASEKIDEKEPVRQTQSTTIISEKDTSSERTKSPSPSIESEKHDDKEPAARSRSSSIATDKHTEVDGKSDDKSRSPSITDEKQRLPSSASEKTSDDHIVDSEKDIGKLDDLSRKFSITTEKCSDHEAKELDKSRSPSVTSEKPDEKVPILHSSSPGAVDDRHSGNIITVPTIADDYDKKEPSTDRILDDKVEKKTSGTVEECPTIVAEVKHDEREPIDLSKTSAKLDDGLSDTNLSTKISSHDESIEHPKSTDTSHVTVDQSEKDISSSASVLERSSRSPSIASVHDSKLDEKDAVQALQKLAETIADKSEEAKHITQSPHEEKELHDTPKDRSRSHSVFDAGEKTPLGRSRTASLFEDRIPEMSSLRDEAKTATQESGSTFSYDESDETELAKDGSSRKSSLRDVPDDKKSSVCGDSRKSSLAKFEDLVSKRLQIVEDYNSTIAEISKVEEYIVNNYIMKEEKITSRAVEKIVMLYSMPKSMILRLIEVIILKTEVPRDFVVDYPEYDGTCDSSVTSKDDHVDVIDISPAKRHDIESYIQEEFVTKKKKISSKVLDDMVTLKSVSRSVIIMIIQEIITKRKIPEAELLEHGVLDASPKVPETDSYGPKEQVRVLLHDKNLPSMSTEFDTSSHPSISSSDIRKEHESGISEQKRVQVESYVMEECVKKGKKITVLVLEQIMTKMSVSRSVLLDIIENIIITRKMSRTTMVDDAIYDEVDMEPSKSPEPVSTKDRIVEFSGKSTPDPKSSGYSTPETRQYDDKFSKEISSFSSDYESPFHKAFVGGMTEIRTTHITTLSGKSTPDFGARGETPESLSDSIVSSIQTKAEESVSSDKEPLHTSAHEFSGSLEQAPSISTTRVTMTTDSTTTSALSSAPEPRDPAMPVASDKATGEQVFSDELTQKLKRDTISVESKSHLDDMPDMAKGVSSDTLDEEKPEVITRVIRREVIDDEDDQPEVITRVIRREVIDDEDDQPEVITRVIRREVIDDEDNQPEVITRVIRREVIDDGEDVQPEVITRVIRKEIIGDEEEGHPEVITRVIKREVISDEADQPEVITRIIRREVFIDEQEKPEVIVPSSEKSEIQTMPEKVTSAISADIKRTITTVTTVTEPDGKVTTKKDVQESTDTLEGDELLEKLIVSTKTDDSDTVTDAKSIESLKTEKIITETIKTVAATSGSSGIRGDTSSGTSTPDSTQRDEKSDTLGKSELEKIVAETVDHPLSPLIKDLISDERSYSGKSSPETLPKDIQTGTSTGKSTPDIPASPFTKDSGAGTLVQTSGRSTPDRRADSRSSTATPEGFRSSEVIRTTITTTRTMSEDGDIITTTKEITEATNEKGEVTILTEKTDVKVEDRVHSKDIGESSPKSDHSSMHSRAGTHAWGSGEDRHTYSDDDVPGSPLSTTSQVGYSPQSTYHFGEQTFSKDSSHKSIEFSEADMSSSFYGELPDLPPRVTTLKSAYLESGGSDTSSVSGHAPTEGDFSFKKFTVEKEFAGGYSEKSGGKRYVDDADLDFEKALMERKEMKRERDDHSSTASGYTNGNLTKPSSSSLGEESKDAKDDAKKDPLAGWGTPLGLPSPKPPRKFNLRTTARPTDSADISPDSLNFDAINDWGEPLRLPSPAPIADEASNKGTPVTPKKERKQPKKVISENIKNKKRSDSPSKNEKKTKDAKNKIQPVYMDLTYVPHHGNSYYTSLEFFKRVRARYYVFSGTEPSREVYDALLDAKKTWEDKDLEVTMIPTYDTDTLGYWVADNEEALAVNHIDLSPSASRCTINLQDHETSCSAYRLEF